MSVFKVRIPHTTTINSIFNRAKRRRAIDLIPPGDVAERDTYKTNWPVIAEYYANRENLSADTTVEIYSDRELTRLVARVLPSERATILQYETARPNYVPQTESGVISNANIIAGGGAPVVPARVEESDGGAIAPAPVISRAVSSVEKFDTRVDTKIGDPHIIYKVLPSESELAKDDMDEYLDSGTTKTGQDLVLVRKGGGEIHEAYDKASRSFLGFFQFYTKTIYPYDYEALKLDFQGELKHYRLLSDWLDSQKTIRRKEMAEEERRLFFEAQEKQAKQEYDDFVSQQRAKGILTDYTVPENPDVSIVERKKSKMGDRWIDSKGIQYYKAGVSYFTKSDELRPESEIGSKFLDIGNHYSLEGKFLGQRVPSIDKRTFNTTISARPGETVLRKVSFK